MIILIIVDVFDDDWDFSIHNTSDKIDGEGKLILIIVDDDEDNDDDDHVIDDDDDDNNCSLDNTPDQVDGKGKYDCWVFLRTDAVQRLKHWNDNDDHMGG